MKLPLPSSFFWSVGVPQPSPKIRLESDSLHHATKKQKKHGHTTGGIPRWSPTLVLVARFSAYVWQSGRDAQFSLTYGRMYPIHEI
jgi:hypothetical protein